MRLMKAGQAEGLFTCIGNGINHGIAMAKAGRWAGRYNDEKLSENTKETPSMFWHWQGAVCRVGIQPLLRRIGPGYLVRENTGEVFADEEEKGSCRDPLYSTDPDAGSTGR